MRIMTKITGTKPLLMHNIQLADPLNSLAKKISVITKKKKNKTEEDMVDLARLEWYGSLYSDRGRIVVPTGNVLKCFNEAAKMTREGKTVLRSLSPIDIVVPLVYSGPLEIDELAKLDSFRDMTLVRVGQSRVVRCRPIFRIWALSIEWELLTDVIDPDDFATIVRRAGLVEGLGDNRTNGYGRFTTEIVNLEGQQLAA